MPLLQQQEQHQPQQAQVPLLPALLSQPLLPVLQPLLLLMRPQLENRLADLCVRLGAGGETRLERSLRQPCRQLAGPVSTCRIRVSEASGRTLGVITEMVGARFGDDSEVVAKRCAAKLLGLPPESLKDVSLEDLGRRFSSQGSP